MHLYEVTFKNKGGLVMVSTVNPKRPSQPTKYVFYATPKFDVFSDAIASYIIQKTRLTNIAICSDSTFIVNQEKVSQEIVEQYTDSIKKYGGKVTTTACDLSAPNFQPSAFHSQAISDGAEGLLLIPRPDKLNLAIDVARENKGRLPLFSYQGMYTERTLRKSLPRLFGSLIISYRVGINQIQISSIYTDSGHLETTEQLFQSCHIFWWSWY